MTYKKTLLVLALLSSSTYAEHFKPLDLELKKVQKQAQLLQEQLEKLKKQIAAQSGEKTNPDKATSDKDFTHESHIDYTKSNKPPHYHSTAVTVHAPDAHPESIEFYPTALIADNHVVTFIAGTPVVSSPFLGDRPAFDGSDYIVNISSINRDIRLMQQRRRMYRAYEKIGYPVPHMPIVSISGKAEPVAVLSDSFRGNVDGDITLGSSEVDVAAALNENVEAYIALAYDARPPAIGPRISNSAFNLNMGFVNIGNLDKSPYYFTAGQVYVPFGKYATSMISAPLTLSVARTKTRPFIFGYKSQEDAGLFAAAYGYKGDVTLGKSGVGGLNVGYIFKRRALLGEVGAGVISSINDAGGMQNTGSSVGTTFGGFGSLLNGTEEVRKKPALNIHGNVSIDRYNFTAEWVGAAQRFRVQDLSFNGRGAKPQALQTEVGMTFRALNRPSSIGLGYQYSKDALALNLPEQRLSSVFNISIWKDTVESIEYRHDIDYSASSVGNGAAPPGLLNAPTIGTGRSADTVSIQIGVYF